MKYNRTTIDQFESPFQFTIWRREKVLSEIKFEPITSNQSHVIETATAAKTAGFDLRRVQEETRFVDEVCGLPVRCVLQRRVPEVSLDSAQTRLHENQEGQERTRKGGGEGEGGSAEQWR